MGIRIGPNNLWILGLNHLAALFDRDLFKEFITHPRDFESNHRLIDALRSCIVDFIYRRALILAVEIANIREVLKGPSRQVLLFQRITELHNSATSCLTSDE